MSRSPLNQMAGMTIGAIAMLAMAVPAWARKHREKTKRSSSRPSMD